MTSGYKITITAFFPCSNTLADMLAASARLEDLRKSMEAAGLVDVKRSDTFVKGTRAKPSVPSERGNGVPKSADATGSPAEATEAPAEAEGPQDAASEDLLAVPPFLDRSANRKPAA
jgi:hypothetical protein